MRAPGPDIWPLASDIRASPSCAELRTTAERIIVEFIGWKEQGLENTLGTRD
jgi:hypothetical protein